MSPSAYKYFVFPALLMGVLAFAIGTHIPTLEASAATLQENNSSARPSRASMLPKQLMVASSKNIAAMIPVDTDKAAVDLQRKMHMEAPCNRVEAGHPLDVTVPDGQTFRPGEKFSKTWRLVNSGSCVWTGDYQIEWVYGDNVSYVDEVVLSQEVQPGDHIEVTVSMQAPDVPREYQSYWKVRADNGELFGLGPQGTSPFWVDFQVVASGD